MVEEIVAGVVTAAVPGIPTLLYFMSTKHERAFDRLVSGSLLRIMLVGIECLFLALGILFGRTFPIQSGQALWYIVAVGAGCLFYAAAMAFVMWLHDPD